MFEPKTVYAKIAYDAILLYLKTGKKILKEESEIPPAMQLRLPCFVFLYCGDELKGKQGSLEPKHHNLYNEIIENAIAAAMEDPHTGKLKEDELNTISLVVDVLSKPKPLEDKSLLKPAKHGIIVEDENANSSVVFPNKDGMVSIDEQIKVARRKAGIEDHVPDERIRLRHFTTTSYV
jgi:AMMECR1 domain-containing protein